MTELCQYLKWDSDFFGHRIAKLTINRLNEKTVKQAIDWCQTNDINCLYFLADTDNQRTVELAEFYRFALVDIRITLERKIDFLIDKQQKVKEKEIRLCRSDDVPTLQEIAKSGHRDSRFYYDPNFSKENCDAFYARWIENSCTGYADAVFVYEVQGKPAGYISCHLREQNRGQIGLIGVSEMNRGQGIGSKLVGKAVHWFAEQGKRQVSVVTQGRNSQAQRLYQRAVFMTSSVQLWYHIWFPLNRTGFENEWS